MPIVTIQSVGEMSKEQKAKIAEEVTQTLSKVADKSPASVYITFEEFERSNWAKGGKLLG